MEQPPPRQPGRIRRFVAWYRRQSRLMQLVVALAILAIVLFVGSAAISGIVESIQEPLVAPTSVTADQPTSAPTQASTPTNTPTVKQNIVQLVDSHTSDADKIEFPQNDGKTVVVQITLSEQLDSNSARITIQDNCFNIQQALWTAHIASLKDVDLAFRGPSVDKFGNKSIAPYGVCDLTKATAAKFRWDNLNAQSGWNAYDQAMFYAIISG